MNKGFTFIFAFSLGAAAGVAVSWKVLKKKFAQEAKEEIEEVRAYYSEKNSEEKEPNESDKNDEADKEADMKEYAKQLAKSGYTKYSDAKQDDKVADKDRPYVITPEEFNEGEYDAESLIYYADGVLTDDANEIVEDVEALVGEDSLTHFGEYEDCSVYVRNDRLKTDYEILLDSRTYAVATGKAEG